MVLVTQRFCGGSFRTGDHPTVIQCTVLSPSVVPYVPVDLCFHTNLLVHPRCLSRFVEYALGTLQSPTPVDASVPQDVLLLPYLSTTGLTDTVWFIYGTS
jgi:hypothetical protein